MLQLTKEGASSPVEAERSPKKRKKRSASSSDVELIAESSSSQLEFAKPQANSHRELNKEDETLGTSRFVFNDLVSYTFGVEDDIVECPLCSQRVELSTINKHMDQQCPPIQNSATASERRLSSKHGWSKILSGAKGKGKESSVS